jgi:transcriptional regulator
MKSKVPPAPGEKSATMRREIVAVLLEGVLLTAKDISQRVRISEREVYQHLEHIRRSFQKRGLQLVTKPSSCNECGFLFMKRERLKKPGKCPVCRGESIQQPLFSITEKR